MIKDFHNRTNITAKCDFNFLEEEILEFFLAPMGKTHLSVLAQKIQAFKLERNLWVIEKF